jgi:hypothetical protein
MGVCISHLDLRARQGIAVMDRVPVQEEFRPEDLSKRILSETDWPEVLYISDQNNCNESLMGVAVLTSYNAQSIP